MKTVQLILSTAFLLILIVASPLFFQSCKPDDCDDEPGECDTCVMVYKPNIYLYPEEKCQLEVFLNFPMGGKVVTSVPDYGTGWNVSIDKNGLIDNTWNFLFYESSQPDVWQLSKGWIVRQSELKDFFTENMTLYGFSGNEIADFTDYWIPRLNYADAYEIYPQTRQLIDSVIHLNISKKPDNLLRFFYVLKPSVKPAGFTLPAPLVQEKFKREGFYVAEWGVILK